MSARPYDQHVGLLVNDGHQIFWLQVMPLFSPPVGENLVAGNNEIRGISPAINDYPAKLIAFDNHFSPTRNIIKISKANLNPWSAWSSKSTYSIIFFVLTPSYFQETLIFLLT